MSNGFNLSKFNNFLSLASEAILCNADCKKKKQEDQLKEIYLNSQTNLITAPAKEIIAEKNYLIFTKGEQGYSEFLDKKLENSANLIIKKYTENFKEQVKKIKSQIESYGGILVNFRNIVDLYVQYKKENIELMKELKQETNDILTNERKTFYEDQNIDRLKFIYKYIFITVYFIVVFCFGIFSLIYPSSYNWKIRLALFMFYILLPLISSWIIGKFIYLLYEIYNLLPKNVYRQN